MVLVHLCLNTDLFSAEKTQAVCLSRIEMYEIKKWSETMLCLSQLIENREIFFLVGWHEIIISDHYSLLNSMNVP